MQKLTFFNVAAKHRMKIFCVRKPPNWRSFVTDEYHGNIFFKCRVNELLFDNIHSLQIMEIFPKEKVLKDEKMS